jgi:phosphoribosylglycinamide formyltransferase-1
MKTPRLGILISGGGTTLQNLADRIAAGALDASIAVVIASNPSCYGITRAQNLGLPVEIITRKAAGSLDAFSRQIAAALRTHNVDLALMAGFLSLWTIPPDFSNRVMNIHPALLPKFGGQGMHGHHVHQAVLAAGETESGCTVHFADNTYDTGPIILQRRVPVLSGDTPDALAARVFEQECLAYPEAVRWWAEELLERDGERAYLRKVLGYIVRHRPHGRELLVFDHVHVPAAGTQVVHGTLHHGEDPAAGMLREAQEEAGLHGLSIVRKLGVFDWRNPAWGCLFERHVFELAAPPDAPDSWEHHETDGGAIPATPDKLFRFRWVPLTANIPLAAGHNLYLFPLVNPV